MAAGKARDPPADHTDPTLSRLLARRLRAHGVGDVAVVESRMARGRSRRAAALGYTSDSYRVVDLSDEMEPFDYGGVLGPGDGRADVRDADVRISFAKNKSHPRIFYSGSLANLIGCLPEPDKLAHYAGPGHETSECCRTILDAMSVPFGLVDAWVSRSRKGACAPARCSRAQACRAGLGDGREDGPRPGAQFGRARGAVAPRPHTAAAPRRRDAVAAVAQRVGRRRRAGRRLAEQPWLLRRREGGWTIQ